MSFISNSINKFILLLICTCMMCMMIASIFSSSLYENLLVSKSIAGINYTLLVHREPCTVYLHSPLGRLGNILFEFATAYGLALDHSCRLYIGPEFFEELSKFFEITSPNTLTESELKRITPIEQMYNHCTYFGKLFQTNTTRHLQLVGYWQTYKYFVNHADEIRSQLKFKEPILNEVKNFIRTNTSGTISTLVGIHIRRGDFVGSRDISSDKFIFDAMDYFIRKYHSVKFIFVSDDKLYCQNAFGKRNETYFSPDSFDPATDMALLTVCDHVIITVGTYGWWAGFLLQNRTGEVLTDAKSNHSPLDVDCEVSAFFPPWYSFLNRTK